MAASNPDPEPRRDPRRAQPGETPPAESSTSSGAGPHRPLKRGGARGPLIVIVLVVVLAAVVFLAFAVVVAA
ncbi:DUF6480 family protein [Streptomyces vilmorinianum]|uniref:DUF6480 family protein n=1 Tax=Streptomyces vilmorinianum TaxID=3051092 RepID=UPI0010FB3B94|nr:DUF6480 family protein [Streptomyces vilmorinianum]